MRLLPLVLLPLLACRRDGGTAASSEDAGPVAPQIQANAESRGVPPPGERTAQVPSGMQSYSELLPPPVVAAHAPSMSHPQGTVFVAAYRGNPESDITPYVAEWDLAHEGVVNEWSAPRVGSLLSYFVGIDFDGKNLFVLSQWDENVLQPDAEPRVFCRVDVLDGKMRSTRNRRVPCSRDVTSGRAGKVLIAAYEGLGASEVEMTLRLLDQKLNVRKTVRWRVAVPDVSGPNPVIHAGDSFYAMVLGARGTQRVVRLDDETLAERGHSPALGTADSPGMFSKAGDRWIVSWGIERWLVSPLLERATMRASESMLDREAWNGDRMLSSSSMPAGSYVHGMCTPLWAFGTPLFACASNDELAIVRPALEDVQRVAADAAPLADGG